MKSLPLIMIGMATLILGLLFLVSGCSMTPEQSADFQMRLMNASLIYNNTQVTQPVPAAHLTCSRMGNYVNCQQF